MGAFLDNLCEALSRQHFDEPVEITLARPYGATEPVEDDFWNQFRADDDTIFDPVIEVEPSETVDLSEIQLNGVLDQIFAEWDADEKRQTTNPDRLPYDPRMGF